MIMQVLYYAIVMCHSIISTLGKRYEGTLIHISGNSRHNGASRKDDDRIFCNLGDSQPLLEFIANKDS